MNTKGNDMLLKLMQVIIYISLNLCKDKQNEQAENLPKEIKLIYRTYLKSKQTEWQSLKPYNR